MGSAARRISTHTTRPTLAPGGLVVQRQAWVASTPTPPLGARQAPDFPSTPAERAVPRAASRSCWRTSPCSTPRRPSRLPRPRRRGAAARVRRLTGRPRAWRPAPSPPSRRSSPRSRPAGRVTTTRASSRTPRRSCTTQSGRSSTTATRTSAPSTATRPAASHMASEATTRSPSATTRWRQSTSGRVRRMSIRRGPLLRRSRSSLPSVSAPPSSSPRTDRWCRRCSTSDSATSRCRSGCG
mmetsp:Transcript_80712/g.233416  ORF Transcript_80712/g.233416 Transcript_80712/m.233416 type:complete len:240 (+) Transcript_80712:470-1189(+)